MECITLRRPRGAVLARSATLAALLLSLLSLLSACGGGGGGADVATVVQPASTRTPEGTAVPATTPAAPTPPAPAPAARPGLERGAAVHPAFHGPVPSASDVVLSTRSPREDALPAIADFGATRVEWVYTTDAAYAARLTAAAGWFGGSIGPALRDIGEAGLARDFDAQAVVPWWMESWGVRWYTTTAPEAQRAIAAQVERIVAAGARSLQVDDVLLQYHAALHEGGDFSASALAGFPAWLAAHPDRDRLRALGLLEPGLDYRAYLRQRHGVADLQDYQRRFRDFESTPYWLDYIRSTVSTHYTRLRQQLTQGRRQPLALSMNLSALREPNEAEPSFFLSRFADYALSETSIDDLPSLVSQAATSRALGMGFVASLLPRTTAENRAAIATLYALGAPALVPWDVYIGNDAFGHPMRYYGSVAEYGDLYRFVRAQSARLDGFETAAVVGVVVPVDRIDLAATRSLVATLVARRIPFAFVPVGGRLQALRPDAARLRPLRLLVTTQADADFDADSLAALAASGVPRIAASALTGDRLAALQPFVVAPDATWRIVPRARPGDPTRLVVHLVDPERAAPGASDPACRRRVGLRAALLEPGRIEAATWTGPDGATAVAPEHGSDATSFELPGCGLWGLLEIRLRPAG